MEINHIGIKNPQEIEWSSSTSDVQVVRSFQCTFCKRGFSNAQALGGHMNVHRKDRARLKGSLDETLMDVEKRSPLPSDHPPASLDDHNLLQREYCSDDHDRSCTHKRPWIRSGDEEEDSPRRKDGCKELLQLPLFVETSSSTNGFAIISAVEQEEKCLDVDLELRLGPEQKN